MIFNTEFRIYETVSAETACDLRSLAQKGREGLLDILRRLRHNVECARGIKQNI